MPDHSLGLPNQPWPLPGLAFPPSHNMPGAKNPFSVRNFLEHLHDARAQRRTDSTDESHETLDVKYMDLTIQFIGASGLPKMDVVGTADAYFVAQIDNRIKLVSTVQPNTLTPVWNEIWKVKNVPSNATLFVEILDKDDGVTDDYIGKFRTSISPGPKEVEIDGPLLHLRNRGTFWLKIDSSHSEPNADEYPYLFDGPIRYSRHFSPTVGLLTNLNNARLYSTWKLYIRGVPLFFEDRYQGWNRKYPAAQKIFQGPTSFAVRSGIQAGHRLLYARSTTNGFGVINDAKDLLALLESGSCRPTNSKFTSGCTDERTPQQRALDRRIKPAVYTYIISAEDESLRFSETGAAFFVDFASKHALHSNCAERVRYSGEFHPRPAGGWDKFSDETPDESVVWELVFDNNSGTYAPDKTLLPNLKALLEYNIPGIPFYAFDREDQELTQSREACRAYALKYRGIKQEELQPHIAPGEVTLSHQVESSNEAPHGEEPLSYAS